MSVMLRLLLLVFAMRMVHCQIMAVETREVHATVTTVEPLVLVVPHGLELMSPDSNFDLALSVEQIRLDKRCGRKCKSELCYLSDLEDCRNFIQCTPMPGPRKIRKYTGTMQKCAFGTYWGGFQKQKKIVCDLPSNVRCNIDICEGRVIGEKFDHDDDNCKTYWECGLKGPVPKCCGVDQRYNRLNNNCVLDKGRSCQDACPIKQDVCLGIGQLTDFFDDNNCRTYWDCEDKMPHPVCCPAGQGYMSQAGCVDMPRCNDNCPPAYEPNFCLTATTYALQNDSHCRTFMKCNPIDGDERWCCSSGEYYDDMAKACLTKPIDFFSNCDDVCPENYKAVCLLKPSPTNPAAYLEMVHDIEIERPCAPGSLFDTTICNCGKKLKNAADNSCSMELDIDFNYPNWDRLGSETKTKISQFGEALEGPTLNSKIAFKFNGGLFLRAPFFQSAYENVFLNILYQTDGTQGGKQSMLTNCQIMDLPIPSLELFLENDMIHLSLTTDEIITNQSAPVVASVPYTRNAWNKFTALYDGQMLRVLNEGSGAPNIQELPLSGTVVVATEGLDIGGCYRMREQGPGFMGAISKLQFSKCLKSDWINAFQEAISPI